MSHPDGLHSAEQSLMATMRRHDHVGLLYSGGLESGLLLHLAEPWREKITVYTVRTGAEFPHMISFIDRKLMGWKHRVIERDLAASFAELGLPSSVLPIEHTPIFTEAMGMGMPERSPRIAPRTLCCGRNRSPPDLSVLRQDGVGALIYGIRAGDYSTPAPTLPGTSETFTLDQEPLEITTPLWNMSRADVRQAVGDLGIELPDHYGELQDSLDCSICPATLTTPRRAWMTHRYPAHLALAESLHADVTKAVIAALDADNTDTASDKR